jgi:hypothetical protein
MKYGSSLRIEFDNRIQFGHGIQLAVGSRAGHPIDFRPSSQAFYGIAASHAVKVKFPRHANFEIREKRRPGGDYQDLSRKEVLVSEWRGAKKVQ